MQALGRVSAADPGLPAFLKRLALALAALSVVLLLLTGLGFISEALAFVAVGVAIVAMLSLMFSGRIWLIVMAFGETAGQGLLVLLVPYYWLYYLLSRKRRTYRAICLMISALVPGLLALLMVAVFRPVYERPSRSPFISPGKPPSIRTPSIRSPVPPPAVRTHIKQPRPAAPASDVLRTVTFAVAKVGGSDNQQAKGEAALAEVPGYVLGSLRINADGESLTFQYHGPESKATQYALALFPKAGIMVRVGQAKFEE